MMKRHIGTALSILLGATLAGAVSADGMMTCGVNSIEAGTDNPPMKEDVIRQCGEPTERYGDDWYYERPDGSKYRLHFNDNGELEAIVEQSQ